MEWEREKKRKRINDFNASLSPLIGNSKGSDSDVGKAAGTREKRKKQRDRQAENDEAVLVSAQPQPGKWGWVWIFCGGWGEERDNAMGKRDNA